SVGKTVGALEIAVGERAGTCRERRDGGRPRAGRNYSGDGSSAGRREKGLRRGLHNGYADEKAGSAPKCAARQKSRFGRQDVRGRRRPRAGFRRWRGIITHK